MVSFPGCLVLGMTVVWLLVAGACQGGKKTPGQKPEAAAGLLQDSIMKAKATRQAANDFPEKGQAGPQIAPGACRIVGKIVAILPDQDPNRQGPCGQVPCRALVQVQRVVGYGAAFQPPLTQGQEIKVYFTFTLSPTGKYFPELTVPLPGLRVNSIFEADITGPSEPGSCQEAWFRIKAYKPPDN
jgi:hypothetical protein